ncbi:acyl-CoA thioesterase II [Novosphingobium sp. TH158]|uniref:acyl-CoA thioesterase n=1 Tax=Novosphingobium sp. TH158 TaxID=2067455 RepID=UPI000C7A557F|nr:thioesterase family protein [Novosphingobium sp. TH158]PLK26110.1 thioesterase family protein [Novosphingobium sp. TH158]
MTFAELLASATPTDSGFGLTVPQSWLQGRTGYGGFSAALALVAAIRAGGEGLPPLRSASVSFVGPVNGLAEVSARVLRRGKNATWIGAEVTCGGACTLTATFVFMGPVESAVHLNRQTAPEGLIAPEDSRTFAPHPHMPAFLRSNFEVRFALPKGEGKAPEICWWVRLQDRAVLDPMVEVLLLADALPPGILPLLTPATPVSSMTWIVNLLTPAPTTRDGWWLLRSSADYAERGCSSQHMGLWNANGDPVISGMQSVAVFG